MIRKIIRIDEDKCVGCGLCANACHEEAIAMADGKARLIRDDYCDGLGNCLPVCPTGAISFEEREAPAYDKNAVNENKARKRSGSRESLACGCPGSNARELIRENGSGAAAFSIQSELRQWPVQIKLAPVNAPYFDGARLLISADCAAYAYGNFHQDIMRGRITLVGCPKLDDGDYSEKLTDIIRNNDIKELIVARMEVPCCSGIEHAAIAALKNSGKFIPWRVITISTDGRILD